MAIMITTLEPREAAVQVDGPPVDHTYVLQTEPVIRLGCYLCDETEGLPAAMVGAELDRAREDFRTRHTACAQRPVSSEP